MKDIMTEFNNSFEDLFVNEDGSSLLSEKLYSDKACKNNVETLNTEQV